MAVVTSSDEESDTEADAYAGYEPLSMDPNVAVHQEFQWQDMDDNTEGETPSSTNDLHHTDLQAEQHQEEVC